MTLKALSINQPWAWCITLGFKGVENRDWDTRFRGWFLIHAGKRFDADGHDWIREEFPHIPLPDRALFEREMMGGIVGKARLVNSIHISQKHLMTDWDRPWFFGQYGFVLDSASPAPLVPCKGALGFFTPDYNARYAPPRKTAHIKGA